MKASCLFTSNPIVVDKDFAAIAGLNKAVFLQQLQYWIDIAISSPKGAGYVDKDGKQWIYNTVQEWQEENFPFWSVRTVHRIILELEKDGYLISEKIFKKSGNQKKYYRIDHEKLDFDFAEAVKKRAEDRLKKKRQQQQAKSQQQQQKNTPERSNFDQKQTQAIDSNHNAKMAQSTMTKCHNPDDAKMAQSYKDYKNKDFSVVVSEFENQKTLTEQTLPNQPTLMTEDWTPMDGVVEFLVKQIGIPKTYIDEELVEFRYYWIERREKRNTWNSTFRKRIRDTWNNVIAEGNTSRYTDRQKPAPIECPTIEIAKVWNSVVAKEYRVDPDAYKIPTTVGYKQIHEQWQWLASRGDEYLDLDLIKEILLKITRDERFIKSIYGITIASAFHSLNFQRYATNYTLQQKTETAA